MKPLSILQVIGGGEIAGSKHQFLELCRELQGRGHHLTIITFLEGELSADARKLGIPIQILPMQSIFDFHVILPLRKKIKREGFQIVHTHGIRANFIGRLAARPTTAKIITTIYSFPKEDYRNILKRALYPPIDKFTTPAAHRLIAVSEGLQKKLVKAKVAPQSRFSVVHCSIDLDRALPSKPRGITRQELGIPEGSVACGMLARLVAVKNPFLLLDVARIVHDQWSGVLFFFVGDGPYLEPLRLAAKERDLDRFICFTGYRNDPLDIVEAMDIIVLTSISEGLPVTLLEAMSRSKPVVATRVGGIPEVVQDGRTGFLSASGDAQDFAGKILKLLQDPAKSRWLGEQGRRWALDHFSLSGMVDQTEQIYREVLAE